MRIRTIGASAGWIGSCRRGSEGRECRRWSGWAAVVAVGALSASLALASPSVLAGGGSTAPTLAEFGGANGLQVHNYLQHLTVGPDGNVWFTDMGQTPAIGMIKPSTDLIAEYSNGLPPSVTLGGITAGPDGNLWFTDAGTPAIGRFNPATHVITEFTAGLNTGSQPLDIVAGPDGNLWFTDDGTTKAIGFLDPTTGAITEISSGLQAGTLSDPLRITVGPDHNMWFTDDGATTAAIGRVNLRNGDQITEFTTGLSALHYPGGIVTGPDGNLWFAAWNAIGRITPSGTITMYTAGLQSYAQVQYIASGPDGNLWFNDAGGSPSNPQLGMINPTTGAITEFRSGLPVSTQPAAITVGPAGSDTLWFADIAAYAIGEIIPAGSASGTSIQGVTVTPSAAGAAALTDWTVDFRTSASGALAAGGASVSAAVYVSAPGGTVLPGTAGDYVLNGTVAAAVYGDGSDAVRVVPGNSIGASTNVSLGVRGVTNPAAGTYGPTAFSVWTSADTAAAHPALGLTFGGGGTPSVPAVTGVSPVSGPGTGGTAVTISGSGFTGATAVDFGPGNPALNVTVVSATYLTATAPSGSGRVDVTVTASGGTSVVNPPGDRFSFVAAPIVTGVSPSFGPAAGGTRVTVDGSDLTGATTVDFGPDHPASDVIVESNTSLTAVTPPGSGPVAVTVTGPGGTGGAGRSGDNLYFYVPVPVVTGVSPGAGSVDGGSAVVITGDNLVAATSVQFGANGPAQSYQVVSATEIDALSPPGSNGTTVDITVTTAGGTSTLVAADRYSFVVVPRVTGIQPSEAPVGTQVAIAGSGLSGVTAVQFGGVNAAYVVASDGLIYATVPAGSGTVPVAVLGPAGVAAKVNSLATSVQFTISRPITLQLQVVDTTGHSVAGIPLQVTDPVTGAVVGTATSGADGSASISGQIAATSAQVIATIGNSVPYFTKTGTTLTVPVPAADATVQAAVQLTSLPTGTLSGLVRDQFGEPCSDCSLEVDETVDGRDWTYNAVPDATGAYQVAVLAGTAQVTAFDWAAYMATVTVTTTVPAAGTTIQNLDVNRTSGQLNIQLYTHLAGGSWQGPLPITWRVASHFEIQVTDPRGMGLPVSSNTVPIAYAPGTQLRVCAEQTVEGLPRTCVTATVGPDYNAVAVVRLAQEGNLEATVDVGTGCATYQIDDASDGALVAQGGLNANAGDSFAVSLPLGQYLVNVLGYSVCNGVLTAASHVEAQVLSDGTTDLGTIGTAPVGGAFAGAGNGITSTPGGAAAGEVVTLHVQYQNGGSVAAQDAQAMLDVPAGTSLVAGSITMNGSPVTATPDKGGETVALGDVAAQAGGTIRYQLALDASLSQPSISVGAQILYTANGAAQTDPVGTAVVAVYSHQVTLDTSGQTSSATITLSGRAAAGSTVGVYDGELLLGTTQADQGFWNMQVTLPPSGGTGTGNAATVYELHAQAADATGTYDSPVVAVTFDPNAPQLIQVCLSQRLMLDGGDHVCVDPRQASDLHPPFVYVPGYPLEASFTFSDPGRISDLMVFLQGSTGEAAAATLGSDGVFRADLTVGSGDPGDLSWQYWVKPIPVAATGGAAPAGGQQPVPSLLRGAQVTADSVSADGSAASVTMSFPGLQGAQVTLTFHDQSGVAYTVTPADSAQASVSGLSVYGYQAEMPQPASGTSQLAWHIQADLPTGSTTVPLAPGDPPLDATQVDIQSNINPAELDQALAESESSPALPKFLNRFFSGEVGGESAETGSIASWALNLLNTAEAIQAGTAEYQQNSQLGEIIGRCGAGASSSVGGGRAMQGFLDNQQAINLEILANQLFAAFAYYFPSPTTGPGQLVWQQIQRWASNVVDLQLFDIHQALQDQQLRALYLLYGKSAFNIRLQGAQLPGGGVVVEPSGPTVQIPSGQKCPGPQPNILPGILKANWIEDPSGYVYEGVSSNRVPGATVTALQQDPATGSWSPWSAQAYGQQNTETTDGQGRYGWNVPFGNWQVTVQKPGYATAASAVVTVPPPQYNVNVGLVSLSRPAVSSAFAAAGGAFVQVDFSQYMLASTLDGANITVTTAGGTTLSGTVQAVNPVDDPNGVLLTQTADFVPVTPLTPGQSYTVDVSQAVANYAGNPMVAAVSDRLTVPNTPSAVTITPSSTSGVADGQTGVTLQASVTDASDRVVPGVPIAFRTTLGTLSVTQTVYTDASGTATDTLTASSAGSASVSAQAAGLPVAQTQINFMLPARVATTVTVSATPARAPSGGQVTLTGTVLDQYGQPLPNASVTFTSTLGVLTDPEALNTNASGQVSTTLTGTDFTGSPSVGQDIVTASVAGTAASGSAAVAFIAPPSVATSLNIASSSAAAPADGQTPVTVSVLVDDQFGNPIAGVPVAFTTDLGQLTPGGSAVTDGLGAATVSLISGSPGLATVQARVAGITSGNSLQVQFGALQGASPAPPTSAAAASASSIGPDGGELKTADGAFVAEVPAGDVAVGTLAVQELQGASAPLPPAAVAASPVFLLTGTPLGAQEVATLHYDAAALSGLTSDRLSVYRLGPSGSWSFLPTLVDASTATVRVDIAGPEEIVVLVDTLRFKDVSATNWAADYIDRVLAAGVVDGFPDGTFLPNAPLMRADFVKMLVLTLGLTPEQGGSRFSDVSANAWFAPYISAAVRAGLLQGVSSTIFDPNQTVTREQAAVLMARALKLGTGGGLTFTDAAKVAPWAAAGVQAAVSAGYLDGFPDGSFQPSAAMTRAQAAKLLAEAIAHLAP